MVEKWKLHLETGTPPISSSHGIILNKNRNNNGTTTTTTTQPQQQQQVQQAQQAQQVQQNTVNNPQIPSQNSNPNQQYIPPPLPSAAPQVLPYAHEPYVGAGHSQPWVVPSIPTELPQPPAYTPIYNPSAPYDPINNPYGIKPNNIPNAPVTTPFPNQDANTKIGWFYYEGLFGDGCWIVQSQCRKWDSDKYIGEQTANNNTFKVGKDVGIIRQFATDPICESCTNTQDFSKEFEYICLDKAREFHEDFCDNNADSATVAYWAQDGAGVAEIWNSWDLTTGCVIDLTSFKCIPDETKYSYEVPNPNTRFEGRIFRDSIGEDEFSAAVDKKRCWERAKSWYDYCELGSQGDDIYLNVSWPSDQLKLNNMNHM